MRKQYNHILICALHHRYEEFNMQTYFFEKYENNIFYQCLIYKSQVWQIEKNVYRININVLDIDCVQSSKSDNGIWGRSLIWSESGFGGLSLYCFDVQVKKISIYEINKFDSCRKNTRKCVKFTTSSHTLQLFTSKLSLKD